jgi:predicted RNase H-like nuclease (RuvC/YqgF family)|tara:strand:+ start:201 stop:449 length:249 start_codon:yes stop_codon:yes gene_type:complete
LDLRKSVAQFAKQSHEQQNDLDDQRKAERALRVEKETLEEQARSLKNEIRELNRSSSELEDENRRLNTRLNDEIMNRAGAYA